jgi:hypothetical protein
MTADMEFVLLRLITLSVLVFLPLVPAIIIFKIFPNDKVVTKGPFKGLKVNLSGAFAGYFIVLVSLLGFIPSIFQSITSNETEYRKALHDINGKWTLKAHIMFQKSDGSVLDDDKEIKELLRKLEPNMTLQLDNRTQDITLQLPDPQLLFSQSRKLIFSSIDDYKINPNGIDYNFIAKKKAIRADDFLINLDTIVVRQVATISPTVLQTPKQAGLANPFIKDHN